MEYKEIEEKFNGIERILESTIGKLEFKKYVSPSDFQKERIIGDSYQNEYANIYDFMKYFVEINGDHYTMKDDKIQCIYGKNRSLGDIWCIARSYFPDLKFIDLYYAVIKLNKEHILSIFRCPDIMKRVVVPYRRYGMREYDIIADFHQFDEYDITYEMLNLIYKTKENEKTTQGFLPSSVA